MIEEIVIFGYSGHAYVVNDCLSGKQRIVGYIDNFEKDENPLEIEYIGNDAIISNLSKEANYFPAIGNNNVRAKVIALIEQHALKAITIIHSRAIVSSTATIEGFTLVGPGAIINAQAKIGKGVIINSGCIIEHECNIGNNSHVAPGTVLAGNVRIGKNSFIGANSTVKEGVTIGDNVIVAAGSTVLENIPSNEMWAGSPAKKKKNVN